VAHEALDEQRLRRLIDAGRGLIAQLDLEAVLEEMLDVARELTGARYAALGILDRECERDELERFIYRGVDKETAARIGELPRGRGVLGELIRNPVPLRLDEVGAHPRSYGFPPGHPKMHSFLGVPIVVRGEAFGNLYLTEKEGGSFDGADEETATILAEWAAVAIFNLDLLRRSEAERGKLERTVQGLEAMTEIARAVAGETDRARVLETVAKRVRTLVGARSLLILLHEDHHCEVAAAVGECDPGAIGRLIDREPCDGREALEVVERVGVGARAALLAPLRFGGRELGGIVALDRIEEGPEFYAEDERLLASTAAAAATVLATIESVARDRLRHSLRTAEGERARWARELHDSLLQGLGSRRVTLSAALKRGDGVGLEAAVEKALDGIAHDIAELRGLIAELRPATLDQLGLLVALEDLVERVGQADELEVAADFSFDPSRLGPELETVVYRLAQEALSNIVKHAEATAATLRVAGRGDQLELVVADDGAGFDPGAESDGYGLAGMRERVELAGGDLRIESRPGTGTRVLAALPLPGGSGLDQAAGERAAD
jgi:signal transduction histidine kinase